MEKDFRDMTKYLLFSDKFRQIFSYFRFQFIKIWRGITILFRRRKRLENISFTYYPKWHFENAYLVIDFKFKNAIWFRVSNYKSFDFTKPHILNLQNIKTDSVNFEVFGFFQKQVYKINLNREAKINTLSFKIKIDIIRTIELIGKKTLMEKPIIGFFSKEPILKLENFSIANKTLKFNPKQFKIEDYS